MTGEKIEGKKNADLKKPLPLTCSKSTMAITSGKSVHTGTPTRRK